MALALGVLVGSGLDTEGRRRLGRRVAAQRRKLREEQLEYSALRSGGPGVEPDEPDDPEWDDD